MRKNKGVWLLGIYVFLALYLLPMFPHGGSANELTRWATSASLVEKRSFDIAWTESLIGSNVDTAKIGNSTYSNKPPGVALLSAPIYALARIFIGPPDASNIRISWFLMRIVSSTVPLLLLALWLYRRGATECGLATLLFATPLFGYSLLLFSHVLAGVLLYGAFRLLFDGDESHRRDMLAGAACGFAVLAEFPAVIAVAVFGVGILFSIDAVQRAWSFFLGGLPFLAFLLIYNKILFGSPFSFSYAHESFPEWAQVASRGFFGIGFPTLGNAYLLLVSPARGLFFYSPVLLLGITDFFVSADRATLRHRVKIAAIVTVVVLLCGHGAAYGGWAFGARYLVLIVPLLLDSMLKPGRQAASGLVQGILFAISLVLSVLPVTTFPFAPPEFNVPQNDFWTRFLVNEQWFVPTIANIFGAPSTIVTIVPVVVGAAAVGILVATSCGHPRQFGIGILAGIGACLVLMLAPGFDSAEDEFRRATIAERYFRPAGRLQIFKQSARDAPTQLRVNDTEWNIADVRAYAPDDFPYLENRALEQSPSAMMRSAVELQNTGDINRAERILVDGRDRFAFARCEFSGNLAVVYYTTGRKDEALSQLERVQQLVGPGSRPDCVRTQFLLGTLYREMSRETDAAAIWNQFLSNTVGSRDPEINSFRQQLLSKPQR